MKNLYIVIICLSFLLTSCEDDLKLLPQNNLTQNSFYKTERQISQAVTGVYSAMVNGGSEGGFDVNFKLLASEVRSNNYSSIAQNGNRDYYTIGRFQETSSTPTLETIWEQSYKLIAYANQILDRIDAVPFEDENLKERYRSEVRFLRAYTYFELLQVFGKVPLVDHPVGIEEAKEIGRTDLDVLYNFIVFELEDAANFLPAFYTGNDVGRVTKWAAHAMLGRVCLTGAGYPLGKQEYLSIAKTHLKQVIDQEGIYINWCSNYADLFKSANDNKYHIFEIQHASGGFDAGTLYPSYVAPGYGNNDPLYNINGSSLYGANSLAVSDNLIDSYEDGDLRFSATIGTQFLDSKNKIAYSNFYVKFREPNVTIVDRYDWPINFPIIRYADVLLMYAEILNLESKTLDALPFLNRIRNRAGLTPLDGLSQSEFQIALEKERRLEFAGEGIYWHDLVRWNKAVDVMNSWATSVGQNFIITQNDYIYPLPLTQIKVAGYEQNP